MDKALKNDYICFYEERILKPVPSFPAKVFFPAYMLDLRLFALIFSSKAGLDL
jgi:hypothetical protein